MILGSMLLFDSNLAVFRVSQSIIFAFTLTTAVITLFLARAAILAHRTTKMGGKDGLVGERGVVYSDIRAGKVGKVFVHGEIWQATALEDIKKGEKITVTKVDGMTLTVIPI